MQRCSCLSRVEELNSDYALLIFNHIGGLNIQTREPLTAAQGIYESVENIQKHLGNVRMDLFQCGRVPDMPIEETMTILSKLVKQGAFDYIGLSEASADTLRRAHKIHPIAALETEYSMFTTNVERNGVLEACVELKVPLIAYSPLSRGIITDKVRTAGGFPQGDVRGQYPRMQPGNREHNMQLVERIGEIASKKGVPISQVAIAWVIAQANNIIVLPGSNNLEQITENCSSGDLLLDDSDISDIRMILNNIEIKGTRYPAALMSHVEK